MALALRARYRVTPHHCRQWCIHVGYQAQYRRRVGWPRVGQMMLASSAGPAQTCGRLRPEVPKPSLNSGTVGGERRSARRRPPSQASAIGSGHWRPPWRCGGCVPRRRDRAPWAGCGRGGERVSPARGCASCSKRLARHVVIALVRAEDYSISEAVNRLLRGSLPAEEGQPKQAIRRTEWHNGYWPFRRDTFQRMAAVSRTCRLPSRRPSRFFQ